MRFPRAEYRQIQAARARGRPFGIRCAYFQRSISIFSIAIENIVIVHRGNRHKPFDGIFERNVQPPAGHAGDDRIKFAPDFVSHEECLEQIVRFALGEHGFLFAELSAATNQGVRELMNLTWHELQQLPPVFVYEPEFVETEAAPVTENDWTIERDGDAYVVTGAWVDKVMGSVNLDDYESRQYMDRMLQTAGIYAKLEEMGIEENAPVIIGELEFEYVY